MGNTKGSCRVGAVPRVGKKGDVKPARGRGLGRGRGRRNKTSNNK